MNKPHKHADLIKAWADGAEIEYRSFHKGSEWEVASRPGWNGLGEYRIKPKEKIVRWQWIVQKVDPATGQKGRPTMTTCFYTSREQVANEYRVWYIVIGKAEWTRTEFDE